MKKLIVGCWMALGAAIPFACGSGVNGDAVALENNARTPLPEEHKSNETDIQQAGNSSVYHVDVAAASGGSGRLTVDLAQRKFVFNGKDFEPNRTYSLQYTVEGDSAVHVLASGVATPSGNLHVDGTWTGDVSTLRAAAFAVSLPGMSALPCEVYFGGEDSCLGPYYYCGLYVIYGVTVPLSGSVDLIPGSNVCMLACGRFVSIANVAFNDALYPAYFFPSN